MQPQKLLTIYDSKSQTYSAPTVNPTSEQARRSFSDAVNSQEQQSVLSSHPEDFTLFEIGEFDIYTGRITQHEAFKSIANGVDVKLPL